MPDFEVSPVGTKEALGEIEHKNPSLGALIKRVADLEERLVMCGCAVTLSLKALKNTRFTDSSASDDINEAGHMLVQCLDGLIGVDLEEEEMKAAS